MLVRYISDIHTEGVEYTLKPLATDKDSILALVGDIGTLRAKERLLHLLKQCDEMGFKRVFYILGNHEAYHNDINTYIGEYRKLVEEAGLRNVQILENETVDVVEGDERVRFIGTTLWTDCNKNDWFFYQTIRDRMNDFFLISNEKYTFTPQASYDKFVKAKGYIEAVLANTGPEWKKVLLCHHGVTSMSSPPRFKGDALSPAFVSDLSEELMKWEFDLCVHGHTHYSVEYMVGKTRVVSSQVGYRKEGLKFEDKVAEV